jgi:hypothetical protein
MFLNTLIPGVPQDKRQLTQGNKCWDSAVIIMNIKEMTIRQGEGQHSESGHPSSPLAPAFPPG